MRAICEAVGKRKSMDAATVRVEFMGRLAAVITRTATRAVQKRLATQRNGTTSDLPAMIVRQVLTAVEPEVNEDEELGSRGTLGLPFFVRAFFLFAFRTLVVSMCWCVGSPSEMSLMSPSSLIYPGCLAFMRRPRAFWYTSVVCLSRA